MNPMSEKLSDYGFKYKKTDSSFILYRNGYSFIISLYRRDYRFIFDELNGKVFITFRFGYSLNLTDYNKWYLQKFNEESEVRYGISIDYIYLELNDSQYNQSDFSKQQHLPISFIKNAENDLINELDGRKHISFKNYFENILQERVRFLDDGVDLRSVGKGKNLLPMAQLCVPIYYEQFDYAQELFDKHYQFRIDYIMKAKSENQEKEKLKQYSKDFDEFIESAKELIGKEYKNPYNF